MQLVWVALAAFFVAGCAVVPYPYEPYVAVPSVSVGVPVYRGGHHGYRHHHHGHHGHYGRPYPRRW